jgi:hypothetical protein
MQNILNRLKQIKSQKALQDHSDSDSLYGHMSKIRDLKDFLNYPNLKKANPIKIILRKGDALVIPKNWWHHVVSNENTYGCNFWTSEFLSKTPIVLKHKIEFHFEDIKDENVFIWNSNKFYDDGESDKIKPIKFKDFIKNKKQNQYFWTLKNYNILNKNSKLTNKILNKIKIPDIVKETKQNFEFNLMACSEKHTTHLHYDDEDGLLCVTDGVKEVTLFSPEDTKNLYPIRFEKYKWKNSPAIKCCYNFYEKGGKLKGLSSSFLLYQTCKDNMGVMSSISKVIKNFHGKNSINKTIWSYKKLENGYKWELYNYEELKSTKDIKIPIISYEIFPKRNELGEYISDFRDEYYIKKHNQDDLGNIINNNGIIYRIKDKKIKSGNWILDTQENFFKNFEKNLNKLKYKKDIFDKNIVLKYKCDHIYVAQRNNNEFYIMYIGISNQDFLNFLIENKYEFDLINHYKNSDYQISNEVTLVYDISKKNEFKIKRTAFFGVV